MEMDSLVGFRFKPTNEEIIRLLKMKRLDPDFSVQTVREIDFYAFDPWKLQSYSEIQTKEPIWYFYCKPYYFKNSKSNRHRKTNSGYWKITSKPSNMRAKNTKAIIGVKNILSFYCRGAISKKAKTEWVMHEIHVEDDPLYKEDFVVCRLEKKQNNKQSVSTSDDSESSHLAVAEDTSPKFVLPPNQPSVCDRNHVVEKTSLLLSDNLQLLPNKYLVSNSRNCVGEKIFSEVECQQLPRHYFNPTFDCNNHFAENSFPMNEFQQLPSHHLASHSRNHVAKDIFPWVESQQLQSHHLASDLRGQVAEHSFPGGESMLFAQFDALYGSNGLNNNSLPPLQSPINVEDDGFSGCNWLGHNSSSPPRSPNNPEERTSSYFDGFIDCNVLNFQFDKEQGDLSSQLVVQDKCPFEETGHILSPCFNSSKSVTEVPFVDNSGTNTEIIDAWIN